MIFIDFHRELGYGTIWRAAVRALGLEIDVINTLLLPSNAITSSWLLKAQKLLQEKLMSPPVAQVSAGDTAETVRQYRAALSRAALSLGFRV